MSNATKSINHPDEINKPGQDIKMLFLKYFSFWKFFLISLFISLLSCFIYLRYAPTVFKTTAKIKILEKDKGLDLPSATNLLTKKNINIENEIESIKSFPILNQVNKKLNLCFNVFSVGHIKTSRISEIPFYLEELILDELNDEESLFRFTFESANLTVTEIKTDTSYTFSNLSTTEFDHDLPFQISWDNEIKDQILEIIIKPLKTTINELKDELDVVSVGKESEIISISLKNENTDYASQIINTIIDVYNLDGINDRRLIHKRTIDFINDRFVLLGQELDSIELNKQLYKLNNKLVDISTDAGLSVGLRSKSNEQLFHLENQIALSKLLLNSAKKQEYNLLPANIGLENNSINSLIANYNEKILLEEVLINDGGENNPSVKNSKKITENIRQNIVNTISTHLNQLRETKDQIKFQNNFYNNEVSKIPEKEKVLRSIERGQEIQESLYLFLLQKREEAEVSYAVTEPSIKIVEYSISDDDPVSPKKEFIILGSLFVGIFVPICILYLIFLFDTKIHYSQEINDIVPDSVILGEIPNIKDPFEKIFENPSQRSTIAEASRILASNSNYLLKRNGSGLGSVVLTTSTLKGEGKTFVALNLSLALSGLNKKVLLIGADLRNPQVHNYIGVNKSDNGLTNFLVDNKFNWKKNSKNYFKNHPNHNILISGKLPPNPVQILTNGNLEQLINEAKEIYDFIVLDCAPTLLVTDTLLISHLADITVYLARANFTEKEILKYPRKLIDEKKLNNVGFVINGLGSKGSYGYGYGYKYGYNYGYGYGYGEEYKKRR